MRLLKSSRIISVRREPRERVKLAKRFVNDKEDVPVPEGKQVKSVQVINDRGQEFVQIIIEDEPTLPPEVLAEVTVKRG